LVVTTEQKCSPVSREAVEDFLGGVRERNKVRHAVLGPHLGVFDLIALDLVVTERRDLLTALSGQYEELNDCPEIVVNAPIPNRA
jgi:hypothetical protein